MDYKQRSKVNLEKKDTYGLNEEKKKQRIKMHSFHRYYGKLIPAIPSYYIQNYTNKGDLVFDPFSGSGTVAVESVSVERKFLGVEINPLSIEISKVKTSKLNVETLNKINTDIINILLAKRKKSGTDVPFVINMDHWFKKKVQQELVFVTQTINDYFYTHRSYGNKYKMFYLMVLSSIIKNVSNADLRHVFPGYSKRMKELEAAGLHNPNVIQTFIRSVKQKAKYFSIYENIDIDANIINGNSFKCDLSAFKNTVDLIITNPPYISSVRYIETLKLELYWMQFITNQNEYANLAHEMVGNDRINKEEYEIKSYTEYTEINELIDTMWEIDKKSSVLIANYFNQMSSIINLMHLVLKKKKKAIIKISDSKLKGIRIPTADFLNLIAESKGFKVIYKFIDEFNENSRSLSPYRNSYSDLMTFDYILMWEKQ